MGKERGIKLADLLGRHPQNDIETSVGKTHHDFMLMTAKEQVMWIKKNPEEALRLIHYMEGQLEGMI